MGKLDPRNNRFRSKYNWCQDQATLFNNQMLRNYAQMPQYYFYCSKNNDPIWVGNATGTVRYPIPYRAVTTNFAG